MKEMFFCAPLTFSTAALPNTHPLSGERLSINTRELLGIAQTNEITSAQTNRVKLSRRRALEPYSANYMAGSFLYRRKAVKEPAFKWQCISYLHFVKKREKEIERRGKKQTDLHAPSAP